MSKYRENLKRFLNIKLPCEEHTIRDALKGEWPIRYLGDVPFIMCELCDLAWPLWEVRIRLSTGPSSSEEVAKDATREVHISGN